MKPAVRTGLIRAAQVIITLGILAWVFGDAELRAGLPIVLGSADSRWLLSAVAAAGAGEAANIIRWHIFLRMQGVRVSLGRTGVVFMIGVFFSMFMLGVVGGDVARAAYLCAENTQKKAGVILSVVIDRLIGMLVLIPFSLVVVVARYSWFRQTASASALLWLLILFLAGMTAFLGFAIIITRLGAANRLPGWIARRDSIMNVIRACAMFASSWRDFFYAVLLSVPVLFGVFLTFYCASRAFGAQVSLWDMFSIMPIVVVATSLPITVSGIGLREGIFKQLLGDLTGTPAEVAIVISLAGFVAYVVWSLLGAAMYLFARPASEGIRGGSLGSRPAGS